MSRVERTKADLAEAYAAIGAARNLLDQGSVVDLTGMERRVEEICADINNIPEAERAGLKSMMLSLIDELDRLAEKLAQQNAELSTELGDNSDRQRAVSAYGDAEGHKPGDKPKK